MNFLNLKNAISVKQALRNGKSFLALGLFLSVSSFAQSTPPVVELPFLIQNFSKLTAPSVCTPENTTDGHCACETVEKIENANQLVTPKMPEDLRTILKITSWDQVSPEVKSIVRLSHPEKVSKKYPIYFSILHYNDNWPGLKGMDSRGLSAKIQFEMGGIIEIKGKPYAFGGYLYSALYPQRQLRVRTKEGNIENRDFDGDWSTVNQKLSKGESLVDNYAKHQITKNDENTMLGFFLSNKPQNKFLGWDLEGGLAVVDTNKGLVMHPLQGVWHSSLKIVDYTSVWDENDRVFSAFLKGSATIQNELFKSKHCTIGLNSSAGFSFDTSGRRNFVVADFGAQAGFIGNKAGDRKLITLRANIKGQQPLSSGRSVAAATGGVSIDLHKVKIETGILAPLTQNYSEEFVTKKDYGQKLGFIKLTFVFPRSK